MTDKEQMSSVDAMPVPAADIDASDDVARRLAAIVESSSDAIISKSLDGIVQSWNTGAERLLGYTAEEMIGQSITRLEPAHRRNEMARILERLRAGERIEHFETERVAKDGRIIDVSLTVSPIRDAANRIIGASKVARDISARKQTEAALLASERHLRALVETQVEMVCRFLVDGTILFVNGAYARAQGTTAEALVGRNFWQFVPEAERASLRRALQSVTPEAPVLKIENRLDTEDGTIWTLWANRGLEFDESGRMLEAQSTGIDITERKQMEEQLRVMDERKNQFLATLGHELRNPLAPLRTGLDLLERLNDDPGIDDIRAMMDRQVRHLTRLVDDVIDISRINRGRIELRLSRLDCNDVIDAAIELSMPLVREHDHTVVYQRSDVPVWVHGDFDRLTQVISNLLNNAAKYSPPGGTISVVLESTPQESIITVADTGLGFASGLANSLFDMFARAPKYRQSAGDGGGLGVGLPLARQLVELHGGTITAHSEGPGKGSVFKVRLPLPRPGEDVAPTDDQVRARADAPALGESRRILIVDDNIDAANAIAALLAQSGHAVETVHDGQSAIDAVELSAPDVVLLDIGLPGMDGYDVARLIRARPIGRDIRLFALTGWGQAHDKRLAAEAGFDAHFTKPADTAALLEAIAAAP